MAEFLPENDHPLNQASKKALLQAKQQPEPGWLYCLQLAKWGLENPIVDCRFPSLQDNLEAMLYLWEPKEALEFLIKGEYPEDYCNPLNDVEGNGVWPLSLAVAIIESLHSSLVAKANGYP